MAQGKNRTPRLIENEADVREGVLALRRKCSTMRRVHDAVGDPPVRREEDGLAGLLRIVVAQQVSAASAEAIWRRAATAIRPMTARQIRRLGDEDLRGAGLSRPKIATMRAVAEAVATGALDLSSLRRLDDDAVRDSLTSVRGIGPWTADIYLMFCLGRADSWASGDLALQIAAKHAFRLDERPGRDVLEELAGRWRPWRGVAARLLWKYYAYTKETAPGRPASPGR